MTPWPPPVLDDQGFGRKRPPGPDDHGWNLGILRDESMLSDVIL